MKLSIIIPVYNEKATLLEVVKRVQAVSLNGVEKEIILIDDASTDGTTELCKKEFTAASVKVLYHEINQGKGAAIRTGLKAMTGDYVLIQDADLEYDPDDYEKLLAPIRKGKAQVVYGSRFTGEHRNMFFHHWVGNKFLSLMTNLLYNSTLSDMETCYKLIKRDIIQGLNLKCQRFDFEPEITAKILKQKIRIYEVPISYCGREFHEGKKITWRDGIVALWVLLKYRFVD